MKSLAFDVLTIPGEENGLSYLQAVCIEGDIETARIIINNSPDKLDTAIALLGVKIGYNDSHFVGKTLLTALRQHNSETHKMISDLVEKVSKRFQCQSLLHLAAKEGRVEHLRRLLDVGENVNSKLSDPSRAGETPLMLAARFNEEDVVKFLVERGASLEMRAGDDDYTAFLYAVMGGKERNIQRLIELGAEVWTKSYRGLSALHVAAENGHTEVISLFSRDGCRCQWRNL